MIFQVTALPKKKAYSSTQIHRTAAQWAEWIQVSLQVTPRDGGHEIQRLSEKASGQIHGCRWIDRYQYIHIWDALLLSAQSKLQRRQRNLKQTWRTKMLVSPICPSGTQNESFLVDKENFRCCSLQSGTSILSARFPFSAQRVSFCREMWQVMTEKIRQYPGCLSGSSCAWQPALLGMFARVRELYLCSHSHSQ